MAYRGTFTRQQLLAFNDDNINQLVEASNVQVWLGPGRHAVFYPLRDHSEFNLVLMLVGFFNLRLGVLILFLKRCR
jgi:salicylate hydroxylase